MFTNVDEGEDCQIGKGKLVASGPGTVVLGDSFVQICECWLQLQRI